LLAEEGMGEQAVYNFVEEERALFRLPPPVYTARQVVNPLNRPEFDRIVGVWVDAALSLGSTDLRMMEGLASAQDRRWSNVNSAYRRSSPRCALLGRRCARDCRRGWCVAIQ
jgi:hypothetical protein